MSILSGVDAARVEMDPFPHVVVADTVGGGRCLELTRAFPAFPGVEGAPGHKKFLRRSVELLADDQLPDVWRRAILDDLGPAAWLEWIRLFGRAARREYPELERRGPLERWRVGQRRRDDPAGRDVLLDAQLGIHAAAASAGVERGPHVKGPNKLFEGQWFLRAEDDDAAGAELVLFAPRPGARVAFGARNQVDPASVEPVRTYPYRRSLLVAFLNTPRSIVQVASRGPSARPLQFLGFLAEMADPLFPL